MEATSPFQVFPEEIWELIINKLECSDDIVNVTKAIPKLRILSHGMQWSWMMAEIIPIILRKPVSIKVIKSLRLVSRRWRNAVDAFLERNSPCLPTNRIQVNGKLLVNISAPNLITDFKRFCVSLKHHNSCGQVNSSNPFPGRNVHISLDINHRFTYLVHREVYSEFSVDFEDADSKSVDATYARLPNMAIAFREALHSLEPVGHHIWYLTLELSINFHMNCDLFVTRALQPIFQCFSFLPNLKSLEIRGLSCPSLHVAEKSLTQVGNFILEAAFPFQLLSLDLSMGDGSLEKQVYSYLFRSLVNTADLEKLVLKSIHWESSHACMLRKLNEIWFVMSTWRKHEFRAILHELHHAVVTKITIKAEGINVTEVLEALIPYQVECLELVGDLVDHYIAPGSSQQLIPISRRRKSLESPCTASSHPSLYSIRHSQRTYSCNNITDNPAVLSIVKLRFTVTPYVNISFLKLLPRISFLTIEMTFMQWYWYHYRLNGQYDRIDDLYLRSLYNFALHDKKGPEYFKYIWKELPSLKILIIEMCGKTYQYTQAMSPC